MTWTADTWIALFLILMYFALLLGIGVWAAKRIKNSEDYILAGRSLGFWIFVLLLITSICSGVTLIGGSGMGFTYGWPSIWDQIFVPLSAVFCIVFFGSKLNLIGKKQGIVTLEDYFSLRYENNRELRTISAVILIAAAIITTYTILGGLYAVSWTGMVQGLILIFGMLIFAPMIVMYAGGLEHINTVLAAIDPNFVMPAFPERYAAYAYITPEIIFSFGVLLVVGLACAPHVVSNVLAVKDVRFFRWAPLIAFAVYLTISMLVRFSGMGVRTMVEEGTVVLPDVTNAADYSFVYGISAAAGSVFAMGLFAVMILAAVMSTTDRLMLTVGTQFSWNIFKVILHPKATEKQVIRISQITMLAAVIISLLLAVNPPDVLVFLIFLAIGLILASFAVPLIAGMYWRRATTAGAVASMVFGLAAALCFGYYDQFVEKLPMHFSIYALLLSIAAMVIASLLTKKNSDTALDKTYTGWYLHPKK